MPPAAVAIMGGISTRPPRSTPPGPGTTTPPPPRGQNSWHTLLKILTCPKLRLRAVKSASKVLCFWNVFVCPVFNALFTLQGNIFDTVLIQLSVLFSQNIVAIFFLMTICKARLLCSGFGPSPPPPPLPPRYMGYFRTRSTSRWHATYWNAFLLLFKHSSKIIMILFSTFVCVWNPSQ